MFASNTSQVSSDAVFVEDVMSCFLYTGNNSTQTITNGIDLAGEGGLVWIKARTSAASHILTDTLRGAGVSAGDNNALSTNLTSAQDLGGSSYDYLSAFNADGFSVTQGGDVADKRGTNYNGITYASWTFRKQPKFFDVVTYTGNGTTGRQIAHNLGSVPGCMIVKRTDVAGNDWAVYHRGVASPALYLNLAAANNPGDSQYVWGNGSTTVDPTSTVFTVAASGMVNASGGTYVAYLFAHNAGGFGLSGTDNVISCGSYTGNGSGTGPVVTLGYEPQWLMIKNATTAGAGWVMFDNMRGMPVGSADALLLANTSGAETSGERLSPTATGFQITSTVSSMNDSGSTYIYIAIRRGPMKVPESGTSVFQPVTYTGDGTANRLITSGIVTDFVMARPRDFTGNGGSYLFTPRLIGGNFLESATTNSETAAGTVFQTPTSGFGNSFSSMVGFGVGSNATYELNRSSALESALCLQRAPGFMDVVCYTGDGTTSRDVAHNLGVTPELFIVKNRGLVTNWNVYSANAGAGFKLELNTNIAKTGVGNYWGGVAPTATTFHLGSSNANVNGSGYNYVTYLFATCPGVSKVGSYTGTGTTQQINCGFTAGARFVLIKRTDSTGDWYVWDSARGIVAGNDPYLLFNSGSAEVTSTDYVDTYSAGFEITSTAPAAINASGGTFIFLAIS